VNEPNRFDELTQQVRSTRTGAKGAPEFPPLTDLGNAERLIARHGSRIRYADATGFLVWDGTRWKPDDTRELYRMAADTARGIRAEAAMLADHHGGMQAGQDDDEETKRGKKQAAATFAFSLKSEEEPRLRRMLEVGKSMPTVTVTPVQLDADPWLLNTPSGTVDLRTGQVRGHDQRDLITKITAGAYTPGIECPTWEKFLDTIFAADQDLIDYVQTAVGYSTTGHVIERVMFLCYGETGSNGKSTFLETVRDVLGDYADEASSELFLSTRWGQEPTGLIAALRGRRFVASAETEEGRRIAEARVKQLTGGDTLVGRFLYRDQFSFQPTHTLWLATNNLPDVLAGDQPLWDRLPVVPFEVRIPEEAKDKWLKRRLLEERDGILTWIIEGAKRWATTMRLDHPKAVSKASSDYRAQTDRVQAWLDERCELDQYATTAANELYKDFCQWWDESGEKHKPPTQTLFGRQLSKKGFAAEMSSGGVTRLRAGLSLRPRMYPQ
jgi:putative DNA primase/helicase